MWPWAKYSMITKTHFSAKRFDRFLKFFSDLFLGKLRKHLHQRRFNILLADVNGLMIIMQKNTIHPALMQIYCVVAILLQILSPAHMMKC